MHNSIYSKPLQDINYLYVENSDNNHEMYTLKKHVNDGWN
jgi:hypothetical protein